VDVPLRQLAAQLGHGLERVALRQHEHRRLQRARAVAVDPVDERLRPLRVEDVLVVDPVPLDEVLVPGEAVADRVEPGRLGDLRVRPARQAPERDGDQVLGRRLLLGRHPLDATEVDRLGRVVGRRRHGRGFVTRVLVPAGG
jgi:hypothetical protein